MPFRLPDTTKFHCGSTSTFAVSCGRRDWRSCSAASAAAAAAAASPATASAATAAAAAAAVACRHAGNSCCPPVASHRRPGCLGGPMLFHPTEKLRQMRIGWFSCTAQAQHAVVSSKAADRGVCIMYDDSAAGAAM